jgi:hypothetical protein
VVESTRKQTSGLGARVAFCAVLALAAIASQPAAAQSLYAEGQSYLVSAFLIEYALEGDGQPDVEELLDLEVELRETPTGLAPPDANVPSVRFPLRAVPPGAKFHPGGLRQVNRTVLQALTERGIGGVLVTTPDLDEENGRDLRPPGETRLRVRIWTGRVENVSTLAEGERFDDLDNAGRTNRPEHTWIREGSPVQAGGPDALLRPQEIEDYSSWLSRHPGRRVRPALSPGTLPGTSQLAYHVAEQKPWLVYAQVSNTGTEATTDWRERFGFSHTQLTGRDDVLRLDYVTGNFQDVHGFYGEYGGPLWRVPRVRWRIDGSWSQYDASEVGFQEFDFSGDQWHAGGRLQANVFQYREIFVDLFGATQWQRISVDNDTSGDETDDFFLPEAGVYAERVGEVWSFALEGSVDHNFGSVAATNDGSGPADELFVLGGGEDAKSDFTRAKWQGDLSVYPLPLLRRASWFNEGELGAYDYVQEFGLVTLGQASFGQHLIPQFQQIAGGLYTVRGYDQSATAGDTVWIGNLEYRLHLPRLLFPSENAAIPLPGIGRFRYRPENAFAFPDWDLIARAFVDAAYVNEHGGDDPNRELIHSFGLGAELRVLRFLSARLDLAWAQKRLEHNDPSLDKPALHGVVTVYY